MKSLAMLLVVFALTDPAVAQDVTSSSSCASVMPPLRLTGGGRRFTMKVELARDRLKPDVVKAQATLREGQRVMTGELAGFLYDGELGLSGLVASGTGRYEFQLLGRTT